MQEEEAKQRILNGRKSQALRCDLLERTLECAAVTGAERSLPHSICIESTERINMTDMGGSIYTNVTMGFDPRVPGHWRFRRRSRCRWERAGTSASPPPCSMAARFSHDHALAHADPSSDRPIPPACAAVPQQRDLDSIARHKGELMAVFGEWVRPSGAVAGRGNVMNCFSGKGDAAWMFSCGTTSTADKSDGVDQIIDAFKALSTWTCTRTGCSSARRSLMRVWGTLAFEETGAAHWPRRRNHQYNTADPSSNIGASKNSGKTAEASAYLNVQ